MQISEKYYRIADTIVIKGDYGKIRILQELVYDIANADLDRLKKVWHPISLYLINSLNLYD